ncbi:MAG: pitrilysin family protein [Phycisphaerae bacterium]
MPAASSAAAVADEQFVHLALRGGIELAAEPLPERAATTLVFRMLSGAADDPPDLTGISYIVERTLSKGTKRFDGQGLADAFDAIGAQWSGAAGRQSTLVRVACLPEFTEKAVELVAEMVCHPTLPDEACRVAVDLSLQDLKHLEDDPDALLRLEIQRLTLGPVFGRNVGGELDTLPRVTPDAVRAHWKRGFHSGRLQITAAGRVDVDALARRVDRCFAGLGDPARAGREPAPVVFTPARSHRDKDLKQQYIAITLPGVPREDPRFAIEQVLIGVLSGGMSGRLFTEVREKQGLVYWVGAWHEQPRGSGIIHLGASTTPERCHQTYETLLRELKRLGEDLSEAEVTRARDQLIAQHETEADLTPARVAGLSEDLFFFSRPVGLAAKLDALRAVKLEQVRDYAAALPRDRLCVATLGPRKMANGE